MNRKLYGAAGALAAATVLVGGIALMSSPTNANDDGSLLVMSKSQQASAKAYAMRDASKAERDRFADGVSAEEYKAAMDEEVACISNGLNLAGADYDITVETSSDTWEVTRTVQFNAIPEGDPMELQAAYDALAEGCNDPTDRARRVYQSQLRADRGYVERTAHAFTDCLSRAGRPTEVNAESIEHAFRTFDPHVDDGAIRDCFMLSPAMNAGLGTIIPSEEEL